jgi:hypothetical protein
VIKPTIPLLRKSQPYRISTASVAVGNNDGGQTEDDENDPLDQKEHPMLVQRCRHRALNLLDVGLVHRHGGPPWGVVALASFTYQQSQFAADRPLRNQRLSPVHSSKTRSKLIILGQYDNAN